MNGDTVRYENDCYEAIAGLEARERDLQFVFLDAQYP